MRYNVDVYLRGEDGGDTHDASCQLFDVSVYLLGKQQSILEIHTAPYPANMVEELATLRSSVDWMKRAEWEWSAAPHRLLANNHQHSLYV